MPTGHYKHKTNHNNARKLEDIADGINLLKRTERRCRFYHDVSPHPLATGLVMVNGKEVWLCKKCFDIECDKLQETIREQIDLTPWYGRQELVVYE